MPMFKLIQASLFGTEFQDRISEETYLEMKQQGIAILPAGIISSICMSDDLQKKWKHDIIEAISFGELYQYMQSRIPITVPYVILKGTSAAQYYPHPEYRALGDIDLITRREDYLIACEMLAQNGWVESPSRHQSLEEGRHRSFERNNILIEIHSYFSIFTDVERSEYLDNLILENIQSTHVLPDLINGLVLLAHIDQHFEQGIGLRHIVDWMMFVNKCLPDEKWKEFSAHAKIIGLDKLAITVTRMCEIYLGLHEREWTRGTDTIICKQLMDYIMSSGDFGRKQALEEKIGQNVLSFVRKPKSFLKLMQEQGLKHWKTARRNPILRPFAWLYQANRYLLRGVGRSDAKSKLMSEYKAFKERKALCDALGTTQASNGIVIYKDGKYVKK